MKKRFFLSAFSLALLAAFASTPAVADSTLYDNTGPTSGGYDTGYTFNNGYSVSNSFTLASNSTLTGVDFVAWLYQGDTLTNIDWLITDTAFSSNVYGSGTGVSVTTGANLGADHVGAGLDLVQESISLSGLSLAAGTYYLQLQNAVTAESNYAFWDASNGPSDAVQSGYGDTYDLNGSGTNSETFQIIGNSGAAATPEPSSFLLLGSGLAGLAGLVKRKLAA